MAIPKPVTRRAVQALPEGDALPTEFLIFAPGDNPSTQGPATWDATAAAAVMAKAAERGQVDFPIDLEHRSLDSKATALTKDATDAQGWFKLAVRNGALWAVDVRWTPEGAERLRAKKQRYTSPAFYWLDEPNGRVGEVINVGLVSMPATHDLPALVAASRGGAGKVPVNEATKKAATKLLAQLGRKSSTVLAVRLSNVAAAELRRRAANVGVTPGALLRALATEAKTPKDRARLLDLLGLPVDADDAAIRAAVNQLLLDTGEDTGAPPPAAGVGATGGNADAPPADAMGRARKSLARLRRLNPQLRTKGKHS
jgi:hypothetical protein